MLQWKTTRVFFLKIFEILPKIGLWFSCDKSCHKTFSENLLCWKGSQEDYATFVKIWKTSDTQFSRKSAPNFSSILLRDKFDEKFNKYFCSQKFFTLKRRLCRIIFYWKIILNVHVECIKKFRTNFFTAGLGTFTHN